MGAAFFVVFAIVIAIIIAIRVLAKKDSTLGKICLWYWNTRGKFAAHIPFLGWMAHFIITDGSDEAESMREHYINVGQQSDNLGAQMAENISVRAKEREAEEQAQIEAEAKKREELQTEMRQRAYRNFDRSDVQLNSDGSMVKLGKDGEYVNVDEFRKKAPM